MQPARGATGVNHDFNFYNSSNQVWNGSAYVAWADGDYASYRVAATETGASGQFPLPTIPADATHYELRVRGASLAASYVAWAEELGGDLADLQAVLEADQVLVNDAGVWKLKTYARGTTTEIVPAKTAKQPGGATLTDPTTQLLAGYTQ